MTLTKIIPIHAKDTNTIPEWVMIEINGELLAPKESPEGKENGDDSSILVDSNHVELGAVSFDNDVSLFEE